MTSQLERKLQRIWDQTAEALAELESEQGVETVSDHEAFMKEMTLYFSWFDIAYDDWYKEGDPLKDD